MTAIDVHRLRDYTAEVLGDVAAGMTITITVDGRPVAEISPIRGGGSPFLTKAQLIGIIEKRQSDAGLRDELDVLAGQSTDGADPG